MSDNWVRELYRRMLLVVGRGRIARVDDSRSCQVVQVQLGADEVKDGSPRLAEYGFTSNPPPGADAIVLFINGERTNGVVIATGHQTYRKVNLGPGDVAIHDNRGRFVVLGAAGITIHGASSPILVETTGDITLSAPTGTVAVNAQAFEVNAPVSFNGTAVFHDAVHDAGGHDMTGAHIHTGGTIAGKTGPTTP